MRARRDDDLAEFIAARTQDLHRVAYQLTAGQDTAEQLVIAVLAAMRRGRIDLAQAGSTARRCMARASARDNAPTQVDDAFRLPARFRPLARLSPRQRAALVLHVVDGYDDRETARSLHLTSRATTEALGSVPYAELPGTTSDSGQLRSLLEDFGDLATAPSAGTTLSDVRAVPPPSRRPWWTYVAVLLVGVVTIVSLVISQSRYDAWADSPEGLNQEHGTDFPAYTQGYRLVAIHEVRPGPAVDLPVGVAGSLALECDSGSQSVGMSVSSELNGTFFQKQCTGKHDRPNLIPVVGTALVAVSDFSRGTWPLAVYRKVPADEYPVATTGFEVQHDITMASLRSMTSGDGRTVLPSIEGRVLAIHGIATHPNGTFRGVLQLPATTEPTYLNVVGLLSPTTSGQYGTEVDSHAPSTVCGSVHSVSFQQWRMVPGCSVVDPYIPQVTFSQLGLPSVGARTMTVEITVQGASGPWTLQVVADSYQLDASALDDGANG